MKKLSFEHKRDVILKAIEDLNQKLNQRFIIQEEISSFGKEDNAWLLVLSNHNEGKIYFSVFEWELKGAFIKRVSKKRPQFQKTLTEIPSDIIEADVYDEGMVVFKLKSREYLVFNFEGKEVFRTTIYPEVQEHLDFLREVSVMHEFAIC